MIKKLKIKFIATAMVAIAALLFVILASINIANFALVTEDADKVLEMIAGEGGQFEPPAPPSGQSGQQGGPGGMGQMGPSAPDTGASMRFFTFAFDEDGNVTEVSYKLSAISKQDAEEWARSLLGKTRGWTRTSYRYLVYARDGKTFVTVVDQGRELLPSYRVLWASLIGSVVGLLISFGVLVLLSEKFVKPLADSDKKQKLFVSEAAREIKSPLTVIALDKDRIKEEFGETETTKSVDKQVDKLFGLTLKLNELLVFEQGQIDKKDFDLSNIAKASLAPFEEIATKRGVNLNVSIADGVALSGDETMIAKLLFEVYDNAVKFAKTHIDLKLEKVEERVALTVSNDADGLPEDLRGGDYDRVFERFFKGSQEYEGNGLGLSIVKEIVSLHGGRAKAQAQDGIFTLKVEL
ncbi:MAG: HAMP domain-containing histidine kinase [Clostridia bacterium]|nr:HAMP domain-containing histidine kinase [Clostridia bacterium]